MEQLSIYLIQMSYQQYLNLSMLQVNINRTHFNGSYVFKLYLFQTFLKNGIDEKNNLTPEED